MSKGMKEVRHRVLAAVTFAMLALVATAGLAFAHERIEAGPYTIELGWRNEPVIVGERNALILEITEDDLPVEGVEGSLELTVFYGGESFIGQLAPEGEPGVYSAEIFPTVRGQYEVQLTGMIGEEVVDLIVEPDVVLPANVLQFPESQVDPGELSADMDRLESSVSQAQTTAVLGLIAGLCGLLLGVAGLVLTLRKQTGGRTASKTQQEK